MALGILDPMSGSNFEALETGANVFRELKPSRMQVKAAIEHIAIGAAHMSESYVAEGLFRFLSIVGLSFHDMLFVAESLRRTSFLMRWILRYLIVKGAAHTSDDWLAEFFGEFCADLVEQDVSGNDEDEQAEERMFLTTPLLGHSTSGTRVWCSSIAH